MILNKYDYDNHHRDEISMEINEKDALGAVYLAQHFDSFSSINHSSSFDTQQIVINVEKNDEMRCDFNSKVKLDRVKFYKHSFKMFRKL